MPICQLNYQNQLKSSWQLLKVSEFIRILQFMLTRFERRLLSRRIWLVFSNTVNIANEDSNIIVFISYKRIV